MGGDWQKTRLGDVVTFQRGYDLPIGFRRPGGIPVVSSAGITGNHCEAMAAAPGVVTGRYGTIGEVFFLREPFWPLNTTLFVSSFHGNDAGFVYQLLQTFNFKVLSGKSGVPGVNRNDVHAEFVHIPASIEEQRAIAAALNDVDALIAALDALIAKKRDIKQATMQQLLTGKTRLPGFSGAWETKRLGEIGTFLKGSGVRKDESQSGDIPCVRYGEIYTHHHDVVRRFNSAISPAVAAGATVLRPGDVLFAGSGETKAEIGKAVAYAQECGAFAGGDIVILRPTGHESVFLGYALNTPIANRQKAGLGQGDAVVHISATALANVALPLPPLDEQRAIAEVLTDLDAELAALDARREKTRLIKQGMMQSLLTGQVRLV